MIRFSIFSLLSCVVFLLPVQANALVIDDFANPSAGHAAGDDPGQIALSSHASSTAIGGNRRIAANVTSGSGVGAVQRTDGSDGPRFSHSSDDSANFVSQIVWDGQASAATILPKFDGLNMPNWIGTDFLNESGRGDQATKFVIKGLKRDLANGSNASVVVNIHDARNPQRISSATLLVPAPAPLDVDIRKDYDILFSSFIPTGALGAASFAHVGAIQLIINGTVALDMSFKGIQTNGCLNVSPVPPNAKLTATSNVFIRDDCGVCNGDNSTCSDCLGIPNGPTIAGTKCDTGHAGVCSSGVYIGKFPTCSCLAPPPGTEICGNNLDDNCSGVADEVKFDLCGICGGSNACLGCDGKPNSNKGLDRCGVCDGSNACLGCDGVPNSGKKLDACSICAGDGKSCAGCDGVAGSNKKNDICGVCAGDGTSCTSACQKTEIRETLFQLDAQAKEAEKVIVRATRTLFRNSSAKKYLTELKKLLEEAHNKQVANWILSWSLPEVINSCQNDIVCFKSSNTDRLNTYRATAGDLLKLNDQAASILRKVGLAGRGKVLERNGRAVYTHALELAATVPETTTVCNVGTSLP